jgi:hypothetical protein
MDALRQPVHERVRTNGEAFSSIPRDAGGLLYVPP